MPTGHERIVHDDALPPAPIFTIAHLDYLTARFGNFKQEQSPATLNDMVKVSHLASEQVGANKVIDHISILIATHTANAEQPTGDMTNQSAAFATDKTTTQA